MLRGIWLAVLFGLAAVLPAQTVVVGTGDPKVDVPAVQAAVDQGGEVVLKGHFSFDMPAIKPAGSAYGRMVTVSQQVVISGNPDENGELPIIERGFLPFFVQAAGSRITIRGLRFVLPAGAAIWIYAAGGLVITSCQVEGVEPSTEFGSYAAIPNPLASAILVGSNPVPPKAGQDEQAENNSGTFSIFNNDLDVGGTAGDQTVGIAVFGAGKSPDKELDLYISDNRVKNATERLIDINSIGGRVHIERNVIATGSTSAPSNGITPNAINVVGPGSHLIAHNSIVSTWGTGTGILVQGNPGLSEASAIVVDNDLTMSAPDDTVFGSNSGAIVILGFAQGNAVLNNRIRGRARAALVVGLKGAGIPGNNAFVANDLGGFASTQADVLVDEGVGNTIVVGAQSKVEDHGVGTVVVPVQ
jgi:hypothetical protein